jgi:hypothetical protein
MRARATRDVPLKPKETMTFLIAIPTSEQRRTELMRTNDYGAKPAPLERPTL